MEKQDRKRLIGAFIAMLAKPAIGLVANRLAEILEDDSALEKIVLAVLEGSKDLIDALSDDNPANREQVRLLAFKMLDEEILPVLEELLKTEINPSAENLEQVVDYFVASIFDIGHLLVDLESNNKGQVNAYLNTWVRADETKEVILQKLIFESLATKWQNNPTLLVGLGVFLDLIAKAWDAIFPSLGGSKMVQDDGLSLEDGLMMLAAVKLA